MEPQPTSGRLLAQVHDAPRLKHDSFRTEHAYVGWITSHAAFHDKRGTKGGLQPSCVQHCIAAAIKYGRIRDLTREIDERGWSSGHRGREADTPPG